MKIAILTSGRFHVLDLARELHSLGHEIRFYSYVPKHRSARFGLPRECVRSGFWMVLPLILLHKALLRFGVGAWSGNILRKAWDRLAGAMLEPCEVVIAMSGCFDRPLSKAKSRWNALVLIERGSRHILSQKEILDAVKALHPQARTVSQEDVAREVRDYARADRIVVPSKHAVESFSEYGISEKRIFRNPYGVDLSMFKPVPLPAVPRTLLMVGSWSYQKGCDLLVQAMEGIDCRLLHAGSITDCPFPVGAKYHSLGFLDQSALKQVYAQAHVFVLPSRQDGFGLVISQALASGLPVVCSDRTGGEDVRDLLDDSAWVIVVKSGDAETLRTGIQGALEFAFSSGRQRGISQKELERLSWKAYGRRYDQFLRTLPLASAT